MLLIYGLLLFYCTRPAFPRRQLGREKLIRLQEEMQIADLPIHGVVGETMDKVTVTRITTRGPPAESSLFKPFRIEFLSPSLDPDSDFISSNILHPLGVCVLMLCLQ